MKYIEYTGSSNGEVADLFELVFTHAEGENEGKLISGLVDELIATTPSQDLKGFVCINEQDSDKSPSSESQNAIEPAKKALSQPVENSGIIGAIFFSRLFFTSNVTAFILSPVAIHTDYQGKGIGQALVSFGLKRLTELNVELVFTYGDPNFYTKTGFTQISEASFQAPLNLTYPHGWLAQSLKNATLEPISSKPRCVDALNKQIYW